MPVIRRLIDIGPWLIAGILLGLGVHIASILALPRLAPGDARARIEAVAPVNRATLVRDADQIGLPLTDPAFEIVLCPFDLAEGVMRVRAPVFFQ